ncbi:MAG: hypothetical protein ACLUE1_07195, partial [Adlercreutzia equolifaciens]
MENVLFFVLSAWALATPQALAMDIGNDQEGAQQEFRAAAQSRRNRPSTRIRSGNSSPARAERMRDRSGVLNLVHRLEDVLALDE